MWLLLKNLLFTIAAPGMVAGWLPVYIAGGFGRVRSLGVSQMLALLLLAVAVAVMLVATWHFGVSGRGTPAPFDPPVRLVVRGPHRYVRNPMYAGVVTAVLAWAIFFESPQLLFYAGAVWLVFHLFVVLYEEPTLRHRFGAEYERYRAAVRRWLPGRPY